MKKIYTILAAFVCVSTLTAQGYFQQELPVPPPITTEEKPMPYSSVSDQDIIRQIRSKLNEWNYGQVTFDVNNGTVSMRGAVETQDDKDKIDRAVRGIDGVTELESNIRVRESLYSH